MGFLRGGIVIGTDRRESEQHFHDAQAAERAAAFATGRADLRFDDADYLDHETWVRPAFAKLGDLHGKTALDYGCGHGMASVVLARHGADVTGFDLSPGYVREAELRAEVNGVSARFVVADGEQLPFTDASFDVVWGHAVLHHLNIDVAARELWRVLKPGGRAVFCEPWGGNPLLAFARNRLPYPGKHRTPDEQPLRAADVESLRQTFPALTLDPHQLFGMVRRVCRWRMLLSPLDAVDRRLFRTLPALGSWCRYVVLTLPRM